MPVRLGQEPLSVSESDKTRRIRALFDAVTPVYDGMNDWMSLGLHRLWKERLRPSYEASGRFSIA